MSDCACGFEFAATNTVPDQSPNWLLVFANRFCPKCGGQFDGKRIGFWIPHPRPCDCRVVESWMSDSNFPITRANLGFHNLKIASSKAAPGEFRFWFCPNCGGRLRDGIVTPHISLSASCRKELLTRKLENNYRPILAATEKEWFLGFSENDQVLADIAPGKTEVEGVQIYCVIESLEVLPAKTIEVDYDFRGRFIVRPA